MSNRRYLIYTAYFFLKKVGYLKLMNSFNNCASVLVFHRVNDFDSNPLTTSTDLFDKMMKTVSRNFRVWSLQNLIEKIKNKQKLDHKIVVITFDDGYQDNFLYAAPILKKYEIPATFFVTSGYIGTNKSFPWDKESTADHPLMTWDEVRELLNMGFSIGSHTENHLNLREIPLDVARQEIRLSKEHIENEIGEKINTFSFPFGRKDCIRDEVTKLIKEEDFDCCCSAYGGKITEKTDLYTLNRILMYPNLVELLMELDNFMTYYDGKMGINMFCGFDNVRKRKEF